MKKRTNLIEEMKKRDAFVTPTIDDSLEALEQLKYDIKEIIKMINDENSKPFSSKYTKIFNNNLYNETFRNALLSVVYDRVKSIIDRNSCRLTSKCKVEVSNHRINIYIGLNEKLLKALSLDIYDKNPTLVSIIYDIDAKKAELEEIDSRLIELDKKKKSKEAAYGIEETKFENMKSDVTNFLRPVEFRDRFEALDAGSFSPAERQYAIASRVSNEIKKIYEDIQNELDKREKIISLLNILEQINFNDFVVLREILENELGIKVKESEASPFLRHEENTTSNKTYTIGAYKYGFKYIKKTRLPSEGGYNG